MRQDSVSAYIYIGQTREKNKISLSNGSSGPKHRETFTHCIIVKIIEDNSYFSRTCFISHLTFFLSKCCSI